MSARTATADGAAVATAVSAASAAVTAACAYCSPASTVSASSACALVLPSLLIRNLLMLQPPMLLLAFLVLRPPTTAACNDQVGKSTSIALIAIAPEFRGAASRSSRTKVEADRNIM